MKPTLCRYCPPRTGQTWRVASLPSSRVLLVPYRATFHTRPWLPASEVDDQQLDDYTPENALPSVHCAVPAALESVGFTNPKCIRLCSSLTFGRRQSANVPAA